MGLQKNSFERLANHQRVTDWFGIWPSFHDAEVHRLALSRLNSAGGGNTLELDLHGWTMNSSPTGELLVRKAALVGLRFDGIKELFVEGFNAQNVITALHVSYDASAGELHPLRIVFEHCFEFECHFFAMAGEVTRVHPWQPT
jgi:Immunity protein 50